MDTSVQPIGVIRSLLNSRAECPKQGPEGAPEAWLEVGEQFADALDGLAIGSEIIVLTWLHLARRDVHRVHPRGRIDEPERGVFATRSPDRPNPIGLHQVTILEILESRRIRISPIEVIDGTPVVDIKPVNG